MKLSTIRATLAGLGLTPSKSLGQNFLHDQNLARWIVAQLDVQPGDELVEIGPGLGALTETALATGAKLTALEKDGRLAAFLRERFAGEPRCRVIHGDALDFDVRTLWPHQPVKVFGNLPYYVSTPLLFHFTAPASPAVRAVFLLQRELAQRIAAAAPGGKDYGILSLVIGRRWRVEFLRTLPASVFLPEPKVESALIRLTPRAPGELPDCDAPTFERLVRAGFSQRRKQLRKLLPVEIDWPAAAARLGVPQTARGEELTLLQWIALAQGLNPVLAAGAQDVDGERFDVVDDANRAIGVDTRGNVHARGLRHRAVHVFVFNGAGEIFLQKRSRWKDKQPGKWDSSAAGHVDAGEDYAAAAGRELAEELGIGDVAPPERVGAFPATAETGWEFVELFRAQAEGPFTWPAAEIEWGGFFPLESVQRWVERRPEDFAPGFIRCWRLWQESGAPRGH